jgi:hypothetical protein
LYHVSATDLSKKAIRACLFSLGLDDQNPEDWNDDEELRRERDLIVPDTDVPSSDEEEGDDEASRRHVVVPEEEEEEEDEQQQEQEQQEVSRASRARKRRSL